MSSTSAFPVGVYRLHSDVSLDFQLNRLATLGGGRLEEVREAAARIHGLDDWKREFLSLAEVARSESRGDNAAAYLRAAEFFMAHTDPDRAPAYEEQASIFRDSIAAELASGAVLAEEVPFGRGYLPALRILPPAGEPGKGVVVVHGGFDSYIEELYRFVACIAAAGFETVIFEGPGQGSVIRRQGIPFTVEWEGPVSAVLDHFGFEDVTLLGVSLGGYLAPRAAAFLPAVKRVIAFDVCWDLFAAGISTRPLPLRLALHALMALRAAPVVDAVVRQQAQRDAFTRWATEHGSYVFGVERPYDYLRLMKEFSTRRISHRVRQDFLLMAGSEDHYMPIAHYHRQAKALTQVRSFTGRVFTREEAGQTHCQCGNLDLALEVIVNWIEERTASLG